MPDTPPIPDTTSGTVSLTVESSNQRTRLIKGYDQYWSGFIRGCRIAGMVWPNIILGGIAIIYHFSNSGQKKIPALALFSIATSSLIFSAIGYAVFSWVAGRMAKVFRFFNHYPTSRGKSLMTATLGGGVVGLVGGFLMACFLDIGFFLSVFPDYWLQVWCLLLGISTLASQIGGTLGVWSYLSRELNAGHELIVFRFQIRHLLLATFFCALLLGMFKSFDLLNNTFVTVISLWCFLQAGGLILSAVLSSYLTKKYRSSTVPRETVS